MPYTVWCRNRLIGETDLGFVRIIDKFRSGWFHPNIEGERVMPVIAAVLPAMRAYLHRDAVDAAGVPLVSPALTKATLYADLAEAFQHLQSLDLELRREDGSVIPTSDIGIQDTHRLLELAEECLDDADTGSRDADDELDEPLLEDFDFECTEEDLEETQFPRYQIHVQLIHDDAIP